MEKENRLHIIQKNRLETYSERKTDYRATARGIIRFVLDNEEEAMHDDAEMAHDISLAINDIMDINDSYNSPRFLRKQNKGINARMDFLCDEIDRLKGKVPRVDK